MAAEPTSQMLPASVRAIMRRREPTLGVRAAFARDVATLTFTRLRVAGIAFAIVHALGAVTVLALGPSNLTLGQALLRRAIAIGIALGFSAATYVKLLERHAFALSAALISLSAVYLLEPILRFGPVGADIASLVLLMACTGLLFPYTMRQAIAVTGSVMLLFVLTSIPSLDRGNPVEIELLVGQVFYLVAASVLSAVGARLAFHLRESEFRARWALTSERESAEDLLANILPESIVERLKRDQSAIAEGFLEATVLFADIVGFTPLSAKLAPARLVEMLNAVFSDLDALTEKYGLEKIKTIGDSYMVVGGVPTPRKDHLSAVALMALEMQEVARRHQTPTGEPLRLRIGINTGPVVAGVIGIKKFSYDLWGDTVNTAARMEAHAEPGTIQVTERVFERLRTQFQLESRGPIEIKGKGTMKTYVLIGRRQSLRPPGPA